MRFPDDVPTLTAGDVTLRAHRLDDAPGVVEQCTDPQSIRWTTVPIDYTPAMARQWLAHDVPAAWQQQRERLFAIETTHADGVRRFSGSLSLEDLGDRRAEIAFGAHPAVRGRGVTTAAVNLLLDYGFDDWGLETVVWYAAPGNLASRRIAWKTGFTFGGSLRRWLPQRGAYHDGWVATLHRSDERQPRTRWLDIPALGGRSVRLRALAEADWPRVVEACSDPRSLQWLALMPSPYTEQDALDYIELVEEGAAGGTWLQWAVVDPQTDALLGSVGIPRMGRDEGEIGYWMHPEARGRGAMTEAVSLVVRHAFIDEADGGLAMHRLLIKAAVGNHASQHVARANGFTQYGVERQSERTRDGTFTDLVAFDLLRSEWRATEERR